MFRKFLPFCYVLLLVIAAGSVSAQYAPDSDGDGLTDDLDLCLNEPGTAEQIGCPPEAYATFTDFDGDGVLDPLDACFDLPGEPTNAGCPADRPADLDFDGVFDAADRCPRFTGVPENNGCPADADGDFVPDLGDACPAQPGTFANLGCPDGVVPPDADGDTLADLFDLCPAVVGSPDGSGCPDTDGDGLTDNIDQCADAAGDPNLLGCVPVTTATLPGLVDRITSATAARVREAGRLTVGQPTIAVNGGRLAVRASDRVLVYDLLTTTLAPVLEGITVNQSGYSIGLSADGGQLAVFDFLPDFSTPPYLSVRDSAGTELSRIESPADPALPSVSGLAYSPTAPVLAVAFGGNNAFSEIPTAIRLYTADGRTELSAIQIADAAINMAFSADGTRLIHDTLVGGMLTNNVWDVSNPAALVPVASIPAPPDMLRSFIGMPAALSADGTRAAIGYPDGSLAAYSVAAGSPVQQFAVQVFDRDRSEVVAAIAYSPDGSLLAVAGGVPFSGGVPTDEIFPIRLIDALTGVQLAELVGHSGLVRQLAFSADGSYLISAGDSTVRVWSVE